MLKSVKERGGKQRLENLLFDLNGMKPSIAKQILLWYGDGLAWSICVDSAIVV